MLVRGRASLYPESPPATGPLLVQRNFYNYISQSLGWGGGRADGHERSFNHTGRESRQFPLPFNTDSIMEMSHAGATLSLTFVNFPSEQKKDRAWTQNLPQASVLRSSLRCLIFMTLIFRTTSCNGLNCIPPKDVEVLAPSPWERGLIWKEVSLPTIKLRSRSVSVSQK